MIFKCKSCGGNILYDPDRQKMHCPFCDGEGNEEKLSGTESCCPSCGTPAVVSTYQSAGKCDSCGNYMIFEERVGGQYRPHLILPFKLGKESVKQLLNKEFLGKIFLPHSFLSEARLKKIEGMYVPFWLYDYLANCDYSGNATKVRRWMSGEVEYTETSIYRLERDIDIDFERIPVDASLAKDDGGMDLLEPYDYTALEAFQEKYMSGFFGEIYNEDAEALKSRAAEKLKKDAKAILEDTIHGYTTVAAERNNVSMESRQVQYALMPVWTYDYQYHGKNYPFHINGQTGKITGKAPVSIGRLFVYSGSLFLFLSAAMVLAALIMEVL